jgi:isoleucyl-tRNA synthetase
MFQKVDSLVNFIKQEHKVIEFWREKNIFKKLVMQNENGPSWSFLDGPITANNPMGVHHAWGRTYKDCFHRFHAMKGHRMRYQNGFDCQGLWVEVEVEKELGFKTKRDIDAFGVEKFVEKCKERARKYAEIQTEQSKRLGYWMDWGNSYYTMSDENNYMIWAFLKRCHQRGLVYKGADNMPWCPRCGTGISQHEMQEAYKQIEDPSVYFKLALRDRYNEYLLVWTTTPWTLAANVACAVNPSLVYAKVRQGNDVYYLASALRNLMKNKGEFEVLEEFYGERMIGWTYDGPFDELVAQAEARNHHRIISWDAVKETEGTGIVHIAPGCGKEDFELGKAEGLPVLAPIDENGIYFDGYGLLTGKSAADVVENVLQSLQKKALYYKREKISHSYPHCWRCATPLLFRHVHEWFINMSWREEIKEVAKKACWMPEWGLERELDWLNNMHDWMISKKRYWGLALPIYECECGWFDVVGSKEELKALAVEGWEEFNNHSPHRPWVDKVRIKCKKCGKTVSRIRDVGNPWLDAGIVPYSTTGYNKDRNYWQQWIPADLVLECFPGQFRNWFYALLSMSTMMEKMPPFKCLFGHALVKDENGEEMHKSKGNAIYFNEAAEKMGVDVMRWIFCRQNPTVNLTFGYTIGKLIERVIFNTLWNIYAFFCNYARLDQFDIKAESVPVSIRTDMDRWILSNLNLLVDLANRKMPEYDTVSLVYAAEDFLDRLSNWYVRRNRRRFWREPSKKDIDKLAAYQTLYEVLVKLCKVLAPIAPFVTEFIYQNLVRNQDESAPESIHLCSFPRVDETMINIELSKEMDAAADLVSRVLGLRKKRQIRVRQPLNLLTVITRSETIRKAVKRFEHHILDELNVKTLMMADDEFQIVRYLVKPNMSKLGPLFGKASKAIATALESADAREIAIKIKAGENVTVTAGNEKYELTADDLVVEKFCPDNIVMDMEDDMTVALDTSLSEDLIAEGIARDFVRNIQILRKELRLEMDDHISLYYFTESPLLKSAIGKWLNYIKEETLSIEAIDTIEGAPDKVIEINSEQIAIKISQK